MSSFQNDVTYKNGCLYLENTNILIHWVLLVIKLDCLWTQEDDITTGNEYEATKVVYLCRLQIFRLVFKVGRKSIIHIYW